MDVLSGGSYGSSSDLRVHFGMGAASKIDGLEIEWPSGLHQILTPPRVDCLSKIVEGEEAQAE
jgi:hypothetical protein